LSGGLLWFVVGLIWAFVYNKRYTIALLERGYRFNDEPSKIALARAALGISYLPADHQAQERAADPDDQVWLDRRLNLGRYKSAGDAS
jgi:hypothetical protein